MKRREIIRGAAASSMLAITAGTAAGRSVGPLGNVSRFDELYVVRDGDMVSTLDDPTWDAVRRLEGRLDDEQSLVSPEGDCTPYCCDDCPLSCDSCLCGCTDSCCSTDCCGGEDCC